MRFPGGLILTHAFEPRRALPWHGGLRPISTRPLVPRLSAPRLPAPRHSRPAVRVSAACRGAACGRGVGVRGWASLET